jgi:hypothetical protein
MSLRVSQPFRSVSVQAGPNCDLAYPVRADLPFTARAPSVLRAVPGRAVRIALSLLAEASTVAGACAVDEAAGAVGPTDGPAALEPEVVA